MASRTRSIRLVPVAIGLLTIVAGPRPVLGREAATYSGSYGVKRDSFLVTRFGARCDGIGDDSRAFQAALDAAGARCQAHGAYVAAGFRHGDSSRWSNMPDKRRERRQI
jgi:hypothetical protein